MAMKVLVVEDNRSLAELVKIVLSLGGYDVRLAPEYHLAPEAVRETNPDLVVIDSPDPRGYGPGWNLAFALRALDKRMPLVMLTGNIRDALEVGVTERGSIFSAAVTMPFHIDTLLSAVNAALGGEARMSPAVVSQRC